MRNMPMILIVSITKLITFSSIFVLIFDVNQPCFSNLVQNYTIKRTLQVRSNEKMQKKIIIFYIFLKYWLFFTHFQRFGYKKRRMLLPASSHISYCVICLVVCLSVYLFPTLLLFVQLVPFCTSKRNKPLSLPSSPLSSLFLFVLLKRNNPLFSLFPRVPPKGTSYAITMLLLCYYSLATFINLSYSSRPLAVSR